MRLLTPAGHAAGVPQAAITVPSHNTETKTRRQGVLRCKALFFPTIDLKLADRNAKRSENNARRCILTHWAMHRREAIKMLVGGRESVAEWNRRRAIETFQPPDLSGVDFSGALLATADLTYLNLEGATLDNANLWRADLHRTRLCGATLRLANLSEARLLETDLSEAHLEGAKFRNATIAHVNFRRAHLTDTDFVEAWLIGGHFAGTSFRGAVFGLTYLSSILNDAEELEHATHVAKSRVALDTILWFEDMPEMFLRGCGISEEDMEHFRSRDRKSIQFYSVFISYSHADRHFARWLHEELQRRGIRCWLDAHDLKPGRRILDAVSEAIQLHDRLVLCCSKASLESWWVKDEVRKAQERERRESRDIIVPILVDSYLLDGWDNGLASDLRSRKAADFTEWKRDRAVAEELELLVNALIAR